MMYRNTKYFGQYFDPIKNLNPDITGTKDKPKLTQIPLFNKLLERLVASFNNVYENLTKGEPCSINRNFIRSTLQALHNTLDTSNIKKYEVITEKQNYWTGKQRDIAELLELLEYLYNINTEIPLCSKRGIRYPGPNKQYELLSADKCDEIITNLEKHKNYITNALSYSVTYSINDETGNNNIYLDQTVNIPEKLQNKDALIQAVLNNQFITEQTVDGIPQKSIINFNVWDRVNTDYPSLKNDNGEDDLNKIKFDNTIFIERSICNDPPIYIIRVKRLINNPVSSTTCLREYNFINGIVNIPESFKNATTGTKYILIGGAVHTGFTKGCHVGGHYTAYILNPYTRQYIYYNDIGGKVTPVGTYTALMAHENKLLQKNCTTLFYLPEDEITKATRDINTSSQVATPATSAESTEEDEEYHEAEKGEPYNTHPPPQPQAAPKITYPPYKPNKTQINFVVF